MMDDLISRQQTLDAIKNMCDECDSSWCGDCRVSDLDGDVFAILRSLPPAKPEPKEGQWVNGCCNKCGGHAPFWAMASTYYKSDFCPHCGAKMKGAEHETN